jgi:uroporphyrinogen-III synthase
VSALPERRVLVTRSPGSWPQLAARFEGRGVAIELRAITAQVEPLDPRPGDRALARLEAYAWLLVTSGQGVKALMLKLAARGLTGIPETIRVAAIGPATARALTGVGVRVDLIADDPRGQGLAREVAGRLGPAERILLVRPEGGPGLLAADLRAAGAHVDEAPVYRTVASERAAALAGDAIGGRWAAVAFTAPSSLDLWLDAAAERRSALRSALSDLVRIAIGPTTAAHLDAAGLAARVVAAAPSEAAVGDAIEGALSTC